jgi:4-amino-4-deoxy-L-arabinose transferase-like glycosyltransferase
MARPAVLRALLPPALAMVVIAGLLLARCASVRSPLETLAAAPASGADPPGALARAGAIFLPRGGPYILGFYSPTRARLQVGPHVVDGTGVVTQRIVLPAGVQALRFAGPRSARLLWHPPGRRGDPEYVPASSLSPEPPEGAQFSRPGTSTVDGVVALAIGAVLLVLGGYYLRFRWRAGPRVVTFAVAAVFVLAVGVRLVDLGGAGQTWDEDVNWSAGRNYVSNWLDGDFSRDAWQWNYEHPPVMKYIAGAGAQLADGFGPARALSAVMVAAACALMVLIGRRLFSLRVGVFAGLVSALLPPLIAHGQVVGHEAPTVLWWTLGLWLAVTAHDVPAGESALSPRRLMARLVGLGVVLGLAVGSRFIGGLLAPMIGGALLLHAAPADRARTVRLGLAIIPAVAVLVFVALWPRMWSEPLANLAASWAKLKKPHGAEPYLGELTNSPARTYFLVYLAATAPLGVLLAVVAGLLCGVRALWRKLPGRSALGIVGVWLVVPLVVSFSPVRQDGIRYILPSVLALVMLAAIGLDGACSLLEARIRGARRWSSWMLAALTAAYLAVVCLRIHPYYLDYFGEHVGGPAVVSRKGWFETGWWGEGLADAVAHVNRHAAPGARVYRNCVDPVTHLAWFRGDLWDSMATTPDDADWIVVYQPSVRKCPLPVGAVLEHEVSAQGAPLARVYRVRR